MAAGLPVVAAHVGSVPEVITHGVDGYLHRPGDVAALQRLLCNIMRQPGEAARMGREARRTALSRFAAERVLAQLGSLYTELGVRRDVPTAETDLQASRRLA
jgi:glycosyltransferase involved in cell wall biosynthesis